MSQPPTQERLFRWPGHCPACGAPIEFVATERLHTARWCCLACTTVGSTAFGLPTAEHPEGGPRAFSGVA